jgi:uncharacterized membrane protein YphA (DoxX/SURF4 family)
MFRSAMISPAATPAPAVLPVAPWRRILGIVGGLVLGGVLLFAAWAKALDPSSFAEQIRAEGLDFALPAATVALLALALEVGLGAALVLGIRRLWVLIPAALLVAFFLFLTGRTYWRDLQGIAPDAEAAGCGCFGNLVQRTPAEAFWQDFPLLVLPLLLLFLGRQIGRPTFPPVRTAVVAALTLGATAFAWKAPELPLDDLATRLKPGVGIGALCAGEGDTRLCLDTLVPELREGEHLVVMTTLTAPDFEAAVDTLNSYARAGRGPALTVLSSATPQEHFQFHWRFGPGFRLAEAPAALLRPLYRRLPRSFEVRDGTVVRTFPGLPPFSPSGELRAAAPPDSISRPDENNPRGPR